MERHLLGQTCALLTAMCWAFALIMFKRCGEKISPLALNLFKNTIGLALLVLTLVATGDGLGALRDRPPADLAILLISGFLGIAVADTVFFYGLNLMGVGISAIVDCLYTPFVILFSLVLLSEGLTGARYLGAALIVAGVLVSSRLPPPAGRTRGQLLLGMTCGASAMLMMTFGIVFAKPVLDLMDFPLIWATTLRLFAGTVSLAALAAASPRRAELFSAFRPSRMWKYSLPGSVLGTYVCLVLWVAGFKWTYASVAAALNQTSTIFALILAALILKEPFTRRKFVSIVLALAGVMLVTLYDRL